MGLVSTWTMGEQEFDEALARSVRPLARKRRKCRSSPQSGSRVVILLACHLRISGGTRDNDGLETGIVGGYGRDVSVATPSPPAPLLPRGSPRALFNSPPLPTLVSRP